ncbi:hypothetical protein DJ74_07950 [Halorubrum sp. Ea8]|nr:hypothetical protein DJ74_07950 [Halorubrum sp. Ea8]
MRVALRTGARIGVLTPSSASTTHGYRTAPSLGVFEGALDRTVDLDGCGTGDPFEFLDEPSEPVDEWIDRAVDHHRDSLVFD